MSEDDIAKSAVLKASALFIAAVGICCMAFWVVAKDYSENGTITRANKEDLILIKASVAQGLKHDELTDRKFEAQMKTNHHLDLTVQKLNSLIEAAVVADTP